MEKIMVPEFINQMSEDEIRNVLAGINLERRKIFLEVRDENNNIVGFKQVISLKKKKKYLSFLMNRLEELNKEKIGAIQKSKIKKDCKEEIDIINSFKSYVTFMDGDEQYPTAYEDVKEDLCSIARMESYKKKLKCTLKK